MGRADGQSGPGSSSSVWGVEVCRDRPGQRARHLDGTGGACPDFCTSRSTGGGSEPSSHNTSASESNIAGNALQRHRTKHHGARWRSCADQRSLSRPNPWCGTWWAVVLAWRSELWAGDFPYRGSWRPRQLRSQSVGAAITEYRVLYRPRSLCSWHHDQQRHWDGGGWARGAGHTGSCAAGGSAASGAGSGTSRPGFPVTGYVECD